MPGLDCKGAIELAEVNAATTVFHREPYAGGDIGGAATKASHSRSGWPPKIHTLKEPCPFPHCKATVGHQHTDSGTSS
jgi:hypothetical protein